MHKDISRTSTSLRQGIELATLGEVDNVSVRCRSKYNDHININMYFNIKIIVIVYLMFIKSSIFDGQIHVVNLILYVTPS